MKENSSMPNKNQNATHDQKKSAEKVGLKPAGNTVAGGSRNDTEASKTSRDLKGDQVKTGSQTHRSNK